VVYGFAKLLSYARVRVHSETHAVLRDKEELVCTLTYVGAHLEVTRVSYPGDVVLPQLLSRVREMVKVVLNIVP
jgi:hypothetical protein